MKEFYCIVGNSFTNIFVSVNQKFLHQSWGGFYSSTIEECILSMETLYENTKYPLVEELVYDYCFKIKDNHLYLSYNIFKVEVPDQNINQLNNQYIDAEFQVKESYIRWVKIL